MVEMRASTRGRANTSPRRSFFSFGFGGGGPEPFDSGGATPFVRGSAADSAAPSVALAMG